MAGNPNFETGKPVGESVNMIKNIFDMGGNVSEWTVDQYTFDSNFYSVREGGYGNTGSSSPVADRGFSRDSNPGNGHRFSPCTLFVTMLIV